MKILPCTEGCLGRPALQSKKRAPIEVPHIVGTLSSPVYQYACQRCGRLCRITSIQFATLPRMTIDQLSAAGLLPSYDELADPTNLDLIGDLPPRSARRP